jgi:hypothetical protein
LVDAVCEASTKRTGTALRLHASGEGKQALTEQRAAVLTSEALLRCKAIEEAREGPGFSGSRNLFEFGSHRSQERHVTVH